MTYLSRIRINPRRTVSRRLLTSPRVMRGALLHGIPDQPTEERVLWRLDTDNPLRPMLLVLTETRPDWTHLVEQAGWPAADGGHWIVRDYRRLFARLAPGREFAFRVTANPVQNVARPLKPSAIQAERVARGGHRSFRIGHRTAAQQSEWFLRRTEGWGFEVPEAHADAPAPGLAYDGQAPPPARDLRITARERRSFAKRNGAKHVVLHTATFEGRLRVTAPERFTAALLGGIGPAKAYGCGLLTLAPLSGGRDETVPEHP